MSSLVLSALLICSLIPIHSITACQRTLKKLSATDVSNPVDPSPSPLPPPTTAHTWHWRIVPPEQRNGGFVWRTGIQTFLSQWRGWPAGSISTHFKLCSIRSTMFGNKAGDPHSNGVFGDASVFLVVLRFKRVSPIICFVAAMLPEK